MAYLMVIFGVWLVWNLLLTFFATPEWFPYLVSILLGIGMLLGIYGLCDPGFGRRERVG